VEEAQKKKGSGKEREDGSDYNNIFTNIRIQICNT
jgi:hypothetical protein